MYKFVQFDFGTTIKNVRLLYKINFKKYLTNTKNKIKIRLLKQKGDFLYAISKVSKFFI